MGVEDIGIDDDSRLQAVYMSSGSPSIRCSALRKLLGMLVKTGRLSFPVNQDCETEDQHERLDQA